MTKKFGTRPDKQARTAARRNRAVELRAQRYSWIKIAETIRHENYDTTDRYNEKSAWQDVNRALKDRQAELAESVDALRQIELEALASVEREVLDILAKEYPLVIGKEIIEGEHDESTRLAAVDRLVKISQRRAKLLGLDMPAQVEVKQELVEYTLKLD